MKTIKLNLSVIQQLLIRSLIRKEIHRQYALLDFYLCEGLDVSPIHEDIFELKTLYRQFTGEPFRF